jgi:hypothetical protein
MKEKYIHEGSLKFCTIQHNQHINGSVRHRETNMDVKFRNLG